MSNSTDRRQSTAFWGILIAGTIGLLAMSSMGFWGARSPLLKVRLQLSEKLGVTVVRTDRIFGEVEKAGRSLRQVVGIELGVEEALTSEEARREVALFAFDYFNETGANDALEFVAIVDGGQLKSQVERADVSCYRKARRAADFLSSVIEGDGLRGARLEVRDAYPDGVCLDIQTRAEFAEKQRVSVGSRAARRIGTLDMVPIRRIRVRFFDAERKPLACFDYNGQGQLLAAPDPAKTEEKKPEEKPAEPSKPDAAPRPKSE